MGGLTINVISAYVLQASLDDEVKNASFFWDELDEVVRGIPRTEKLILGEDFNGHIGTTSRGFDDVHGGFVFEYRNEGGVSH